MTLLSDYETQVADLLHDPNNLQWSLQQLDRYINEARRQLVMDTGCLRTLQTIYCTTGQENYPFGQLAGVNIVSGGSSYTAPTVTVSGGGGSGAAVSVSLTNGVVTGVTVTDPGSNYTSAPTLTINDATGYGAQIVGGVINVQTYDVLDVYVLWGTLRYRLRWQDWSTFSTRWRAFVTMQQQPTNWAVYGQNAIYLAPLPNQTYPLEVDTIILPTPYAPGDYTTVDSIPPMSQDPIKFYAAYLAKFYDQSYGEAEIFRQQYQVRLEDVEGSYTRRVKGTP